MVIFTVVNENHWDMYHTVMYPMTTFKLNLYF